MTLNAVNKIWTSISIKQRNKHKTNILMFERHFRVHMFSGWNPSNRTKCLESTAGSSQLLSQSIFIQILHNIWVLFTLLLSDPETGIQLLTAQKIHTRRGHAERLKTRETTVCGRLSGAGVCVSLHWSVCVRWCAADKRWTTDRKRWTEVCSGQGSLPQDIYRRWVMIRPKNREALPDHKRTGGLQSLQNLRDVQHWAEGSVSF